MNFGNVYFSILCYIWSAIAIISRIAMFAMKDNWNKWETEKAYSQKKPFWVYIVCIVGIVIIITTWYVNFKYNVSLGWILSILITLTSIKMVNIIFNYNKFRDFIIKTLNNKGKMMKLNVLVLALSIILIFMGIFLY